MSQAGLTSAFSVALPYCFTIVFFYADEFHLPRQLSDFRHCCFHIDCYAGANSIFIFEVLSGETYAVLCLLFGRTVRLSHEDRRVCVSCAARKCGACCRQCNHFQSRRKCHGSVTLLALRCRNSVLVSARCGDG